MGADRKAKHARRVALGVAFKLVRSQQHVVRNADDIAEARTRLGGRITQARAKFMERVSAKSRGTHFDDALDEALDRALRGLPLDTPKEDVAPEVAPPLPDLDPIVDGSYRDAPPSKKRPRPRGPLVAQEGPHEPLFVEDPNSRPSGMLKLFGILLAVAQALALLWAAGTHAPRSSYLTAVIVIAILFGIPIVMAWSELTTPPDPR